MNHLPDTASLVLATVMLLLIAAGTLALTRKVRLPYTIVLVVIGMLLTGLEQQLPQIFGVLQNLSISPELILFVFLPTLIFESTFNMDAQQLRHDLGPVLALAVPGLIISTAVIGFIVWGASEIPLVAALLLGAILSATDPVAVIALFKQLGAPNRLVVLVEGESLFNDATSLVLAKILLAVVVAGTLSEHAITDGVLSFLVLFVGGALVGWLMGLIFGWLLGLVESDSLIEISLTTSLAYLSFLIAEELLHVSGVMATVAAGITLGGWGRAKISAPVRDYLEHFWEYLAFLANAFIFLLVGMKVDLFALWENIDLLLLVILAMSVARAALVYGLVPLVGLWPGVQAVERRYQTVMLWGGLRGAIALAIVLSLPEFGYNDLFEVLVIGAVLFTLFVQGLSIAGLMRWLGLNKPTLMDQLALLEYKLHARQAARDHLPEMQQQAGGHFSGPIAARVERELNANINDIYQQLAELRQQELPHQEACRILCLRSFGEESQLYNNMFSKGHLSETAYRQLQFSLKQQTDALRYPDHQINGHTRPWQQRVMLWVLQIMDSSPLLNSLAERLRRNRLATGYEKSWGRYLSSRRVLALLDELARLDSIPLSVVDEVRYRYQQWFARARHQLDSTAEQFPEFVNSVHERLAHRMIHLMELRTSEKMAEHGVLSRTLEEQVKAESRHQLRLLRGQEVARLRVAPHELLRKVPCFAGLPQQAFRLLVDGMRSHTYEEEEQIIVQGDPGDSLFLIVRGVVRVSRQEDGKVRNLATLLAGDFFGEMALLHQEPRSATVTTVSPCSVYELKRSLLESAMEDYPVIREVLERAGRMRQLEHSK